MKFTKRFHLSHGFNHNGPIWYGANITVQFEGEVSDPRGEKLTGTVTVTVLTAPESEKWIEHGRLAVQLDGSDTPRSQTVFELMNTPTDGWVAIPNSTLQFNLRVVGASLCGVWCRSVAEAKESAHVALNIESGSVLGFEISGWWLHPIDTEA